MTYNPHDVRRWEGATFVTLNSRYSVINGRIHGSRNPLLEGIAIIYVNGIDFETRKEIDIRLRSGPYTPEAHRGFNDIALKKPLAPEKELWAIFGLGSEDGQRTGSPGITTSRILSIKK